MIARICNLTVFLTFVLSAPALLADTRLIFPRIVFQNGLFSGIAVSNPTGASATIKLTAYNVDGTRLGTAGTQNDVTAELASGGQYLKLASQVFDPNSVLMGSAPKYFWVEVTSTTSGLAGFYIEGDSSITFQYGGDLGTFGTDLYLPAVENSGTTATEISLVNADTSDNGGDASVTVDFLRADGTKVDSRNVVIAKAASLQGPLASIPGFNLSLDQVAALRVHSDRPVLCYGIVRPQTGKTPIALPAEDVTTPAKTLYFPQLADGGGWTTSIGVTNLDFSAPALVNITVLDKNGGIFTDPTITNPKSVTIPPGGFMRSSFKDLFPFTDTSYKEGWIKVDAAASPSINGFVEYGSGNSRALVIAQLNPFQLSMFSHQAQAAPYFTGLAILNAGTLAANVEIFSLDGQGNTTGRVQTVLKPGQRTSQLLWQLVSESADKTGGSVFVRSDRPVFATELFAKNDISALANVPPQQVTATFDPKSTLAKIEPKPALAVVETGKTLSFQVSGLSGTVQWLVNGKKNGDDVNGTISDTGVYKAPAKAPAPRTLTIQAQAPAGNNSGASSVDVVQREQLTGGLTLITSVAYIENLKRFFVAEQLLLAGAPARSFGAATADSRIYEVVKSDSGTSNNLFLPVPGDTIAKMLPYDSAGSSFLLLAGRDSGKIYRLNVATKELATVASGLNQPTSMAIDPTTGNLLVAEAGAGQISVLPAGQIASSPGAGLRLNALEGTGRLNAIPVPGIQGIAVDRCTGSVYVSLSSGELEEHQGNSTRTVETGLDHPTQLLAIYREGFSCATALTIGIVEAGRISLSHPKAQLARTTLVDNIQGVSDITFFPKGNPFTAGGEASVGIAQGSSTAGQGLVTDIPMGGAYQYSPPVDISSISLYSGTGPNEDPIGDNFDPLGEVASQFGYSVPDIVSVTGSVQGSQSIITIKFAAPVTLGSPPTGSGIPPDGVWAYIFMKTAAGSQVITQYPISINFSEYFPFGDQATYTFDSILYVYYGESYYVSLTGQAEVVKVSAIGNTLMLSVPTTALNLTGAAGVVLVGNPVEFTDAAPNNGLLKLTP